MRVVDRAQHGDGVDYTYQARHYSGGGTYSQPAGPAMPPMPPPAPAPVQPQYQAPQAPQAPHDPHAIGCAEIKFSRASRQNCISLVDFHTGRRRLAMHLLRQRQLGQKDAVPQVPTAQAPGNAYDSHGRPRLWSVRSEPRVLGVVDVLGSAARRPGASHVGD